MRGTLLAACVLLTVDGAAAESAKPVLHFVCVFERYVSPETGRLSRAADPLRFEFTVDKAGRAFAVGRDVYPVKVITGDSGVTFLEVLATGAVQTTTVNARGKAVHSRHTILFGELVPTQYYGICE